MSDECDLEELTAFLDASDCEEEPEQSKDTVREESHEEFRDTVCVEESRKRTSCRESQKCVEDDTSAKGENDEECSLDEIEAFLQASDDEEQDENKTEDHNVETEERKGDCEVDKTTDDNTGSETVETHDTELNQNEDIEEHSEMENNMEFEEFDESDLKELDNMMNSQNTGTSPDGREVTGEQSEDSEHEEEKGLETESGNDNDGGDEESDSEQLPHNVIEAEMAAMARRMAELKALLEKSKSSPCSAKKKKPCSKSAEHEKLEVGQNSDSKPAKSRHCSLKEQSKSHLNFKKTPSKLESDYDIKHGKSSASSPKSTKKPKDKQKSFSTEKKPKDKHKSFSTEKSCKTDRHYSDVTDSKMKQTAKCKQQPKVKDTGPNKQKLKSSQNSQIDQGSEYNPFFADTKKAPSTESRLASFNNKEEPVDSKALFGDSDSDWEDLCGDEKSKLSKEGKELQKMISSGQRKREAHTPSYDPTVLKKPNTARWTDTNSKPIKLHPIQGVSQKPALNPDTGTVSGKYRVKDEYMQRSTLAKEDERESVTDPFCGIRIINPRVPMDVFQKKMEGRNLVRIAKLASKTGHAELQRENWVTLGVVVHRTEPRQSAVGKTYCIWKLSDLQNCDRTVTFFLFGNVYKEHWKNDLGVVIGLLNPSIMDKAEKNQSEVAVTINHPQQLLIMGISKDLGRCRGTTKAGQPCSSFINKMQGEYCTYHVQSAYRKSSSKRTELQASTGVTPKAFTQQKNKNLGSGCFFYGGNTYTSQKPQAKSSKDAISLKKLQSFEAKKAPGKITTMSLHDLEPDDEKKIDKLKEKDKDLLSLLSVPSAGSMNFVKHLVKKDANPTVNKKDESEESLISIASAKDLLKQHTKNLQQKKQQRALLSSTPTLGKGLSLGGEISLDVPVKKGKGCATAELAKQLAIAKVKAKGGLNKEDPNAVKKKLTSPEAREKIKKRVAEDVEKSPSDDDKSCAEPPKKKSKLLGDLDLNSPEVQQLIKKKSKHKGALAEAEAEQEDRYFSALEKKEQMEDKMGAIMEVPVKLFACLQCKYRYFSVHERCKKENHSIKEVKGVKRFFKCKQCKRRTVSVDRLPTKACKDCGESKWERVSMLKERSGPKLESEELCLRGNEQKFLGSFQGKPSLNG